MVIYRMIRTVGITDAQANLNEMVACLERGDHIYIQDIDPLTPEYDLPEVTPDQYKNALRKHYGNRLLKDHWNGIEKWDYFYLKEEPKPLPMEYPPEVIDTDKEVKKAETPKKTDNKNSGKKKLTLKDIFLSSGNKRVKKEPVEEKKETPKSTAKQVITLDLNEPAEEKPTVKPRTRKTPVQEDFDNFEDDEIPDVIESPKPQRKPRATSKTRASSPRKPRTPAKPKPYNPIEDDEELKEILERDEKMNQKIQSIVDEYNGRQQQQREQQQE